MISARRRTVCWLLAGGILGWSAGPALAEPGAAGSPAASDGKAAENSRRGRHTSKRLLSEARKHFDSAQLFYEDGQFELARGEFSTAYRLSHMPDLLYNLAMTSEKLGDRQGAISYLERYLADRPGADDAEKIRADIASLRSAPPEPAPQSMRLAAAGKDQHQRPVPSLLPGLVLLGGGAALAALGGGLGGGALAAAHSVQSQQDLGQPFGPDLQATQARGRAMSAAGIAFDVIGAAAMIGGLAWTMVWVGRGARRAAATDRRQSATAAGRERARQAGPQLGLMGPVLWGRF